MVNLKQNNSVNRVVLDSNVLPQRKGRVSTFNLSHNLYATMKFDYLYPVYCKELNPGDYFKIQGKVFARLAPTVAPVMDMMKITFHAFWVPNRLLWKHWVNFMGEKTWQDSSTTYLLPRAQIGTNPSGSLADYFGVPPITNCEEPVTLMPFRAYNKIYNDFFRSIKLEAPIVENSDDNYDYQTNKFGKEKIQDYNLLKIGKSPDYFTSCLPSPNQTDVDIALLGDAPVSVDWTSGAPEVGIIGKNGTTNPKGRLNASGAFLAYNSGGNPSMMFADMSAVSGLSVEKLRYASALQVLLEIENRYGERYPELMKGHFDVDVPDFLVGRAQYLGRVEAPIDMHPIAQMSETTSQSAQGTLTGLGVASKQDLFAEYSAVEHGQLIILAVAKSDVSYQQGLSRELTKAGKYDYMFPSFYNLGDQAVLNKEIYLNPDVKTNNEVFGYQERYREYREDYDRITGGMRSASGTGFDVFHLAQEFASQPVLNKEFIESDTPIDRSLAVPGEEAILLNVYFEVEAERKLTLSGRPSIVEGRL
jgi:hypothetical protein